MFFLLNLGGNSDQFFSINETTGVITTTGPLDYELYTQYNLTVAAYNPDPNRNNEQNYPSCNADCQKPWEVLVFVKVTDENDSPPVFDLGIYNICKNDCLILTQIQ